MEHVIQIDSSKYRQDDHCDLDDLRQATERLLQGNEQEFQAIKDEHWYRRVFDLVTFSNKKDILVSSHIQTLAQAQGILAEILARLSATDHHVMTLLETARADIKQLSNNDIRLARRIVALEYAACGFADQKTINDLSKQEKHILASLIMGLSEATSSDRQKSYANNIFSALQIQEENSVDPAILLQNVRSIDHKRYMLHCCLEYIFIGNYISLGNEELDLSQIDKHFAKSFDVGENTWTELKQRIDSKYRALGIDGFAKSSPETDIPDEFEVTLDFDPAEEITEQAPREDIEIKNILNIALGETREFRNANLFFGSFVNCSGTLIFHNCSIDYGEAVTQARILLKDGGRLQIEKSEIICFFSEEPKPAFITCEGKTTIIIQHSRLTDCSNFIKAADCLEISDCTIRNPGDSFIAPGCSSISCDLLRTYFVFKEPSDAKKFEYHHYGRLLDFDGDFTGNSTISQCIFIGHNCFGDDSSFSLISAGNGKISDCIFEGVSNAIKNGSAIENCSFKNVYNAVDSYGIKSIKDCKFEDCRKTIHLFNVDEETASISNCTFLHCSDVFLGQNLNVNSSQIHDCFGSIIDGHSMQFESCDFIDIHPDIHPDERRRKGSNPSSINFFSTDTDNSGILLKHCGFDGYRGNEESVLANVRSPKLGMKGNITFDECIFKNFSTPNGTISLFQEHSTVEGYVWNSTIHVIRVINCSGLDKINKEGTKSLRPKLEAIATVNTAKLTGTVGAAAALAAFSVGGPLALVAAIATQAYLIRKE